MRMVRRNFALLWRGMQRFRFALTFPLLVIVPRVTASIVVSNLGEVTDAATTVSDTTFAASPFTTDGGVYALNFARLALRNDTRQNITFQALLFSDNGGEPGSLLEVLPDSVILGSGSAGDLTFASSGTVLGANTTFWIAVRTTGALGTFLGTTSPNQTSPIMWTIGNFAGHRTADSGVTWSPTGPHVHRFAIDASVVPEPATFLLTFFGAWLLLARRRVPYSNKLSRNRKGTGTCAFPHGRGSDPQRLCSSL